MLWQWANSGTQVFILDLDGTLIPSAEIDNTCYWQAVFACFGERDTLPDLHGFKHVSDSGILDEWCVRELGRPPQAQETAHIRQQFLQLLESAANRQPQHFSPLPGVIDWLENVLEHDSVYAGIATGGWGHSARLKLKLAGLERFDLPLASSDDAVARTEIMQIAARRTLKHQRGNEALFTYVGDGTWDLKASQILDWKFIGIAAGTRAEQLRQVGATYIRADFCRPGYDQFKQIPAV